MSYVEAIENITPTQAELHRKRMERQRRLGSCAVPDQGINLPRAHGVDGATFERLRKLRREAAAEKVRQETSIRVQAKIDAMVARLSAPAPEKEVVVSHVAITAKPAIELSQLLNPVGMVTRIQKMVCVRYGSKLDEMLGRGKTTPVVVPRQIAMYLCKKAAGKSLPEIGRRFGGRDHTTVLHAIRKVEAMMADDEAFATEIQGIISVIEQEA